MKRTQIYLDIRTDRQLQELASRKGVSKAQLIRDCARALVEKESATEDPLMAIIGMVHGNRDDVSQEHDRYLAEAESKSWED